MQVQREGRLKCKECIIDKIADLGMFFLPTPTLQCFYLSGQVYGLSPIIYMQCIIKQRIITLMEGVVYRSSKHMEVYDLEVGCMMKTCNFGCLTQLVRFRVWMQS